VKPARHHLEDNALPTRLHCQHWGFVAFQPTLVVGLFGAPTASPFAQMFSALMFGLQHQEFTPVMQPGPHLRPLVHYDIMGGCHQTTSTLWSP